MAIRTGYSNNRSSRLVSASNPYHRDVQQPTNSPRVGCRLYIGNLSWDVRWQDLKDYFATAGRVVRADVEEENGKSKGWGIVEYSTPEEASEAMVRLNDTELKGRPVHVREDREPGGKVNKPYVQQERAPQAFRPHPPTMGCKVYVGNLSWEVKWQDLKDYFKTAGFVVKADVMEEADTGRSKGCGIVEFSSPQDAQRSINMLNDTELKGRLIFVREDREEGDMRGGGGGGVPQRQVFMPQMQMQPHMQMQDHHHQHHSQHTQQPHHQVHHQQHTQHAPQVTGSRIYVGNLTWDVKWQELKDFFRPCGNVVRADVMEDAGGRSKGCGLVEFSTPQEAQRAISELNDTDLMGRPVFIREDREEGGRGGGGGGGGGGRFAQQTYSHAQPGAQVQGHSGEGGKKIYVGNLSWEVKWINLKDFFKQCGTIVRADVMEEPGGRSKGCGIVEFSTPQEAQRAISELNDTDLMGRPVFIREDREEGGGGR